MDKKILNASRRELELANKQIAKMYTVRYYEDFIEIWDIFLYRLQRSVFKTRAYFRNNKKFATWDGNKKQEIRDDPWLQYLMQARNAEEHSIQITSAPTGSAVALWDDSENMVIKHLKIDENGIQYEGSGELKTYPQRVVLRDVTNQGVTYKPPFYDPMVEIDSSLPIECKKAIAYYKHYIEEAEGLIP